MLTKIDSEIAGIAPFFYFVSDGAGNYSLADGFQGIGHSLVIDDNYPAGTYQFTGNVNGKLVTVNLTVTVAPVAPVAPSAMITPDSGTDLAQDSPAGITSDPSGPCADSC